MLAAMPFRAQRPCAAQQKECDSMPFRPTSSPEPGSALLRAYRVPFDGVLRTVPAHSIGESALRQGQNVWLYHGALRSRSGLQRDASSATQVYGTVNGSILYINRANEKLPTIGTDTTIAQLRNGVWQSLHNFTPPVSRDSNIRFTLLENNEQVSLLVASPQIGLLHKTETSMFTQVTMPPGLANRPIVDILTAATRTVIAIPPYTIAWSDSLAPTQWQDTSSFILADTEDALVAIKPLGTLGYAIYKEGSIYLGIAQQGADAYAFKPEFYGESEGPCGPDAIVSINNVHYYMTPSGRISLFTGTQQQYIADGIWPFLQDDLDTTYAHRVSACYDYQLNTVTFFYPRKSEGGACHGVLTLNLPYPTALIAQHAAFTGLTHLDISHTLSVSLFAATQQPFVFATFTDTSVATPTPESVTAVEEIRSTAVEEMRSEEMRSSVLRLNKDTTRDDGVAFTCLVQPGLTASPQAGVYKPYMEIQALRGEVYGLVNIYEVTSHLLETEDGTVDDKATLLDLTIITPTQFLGFSISATYLSFLLEWQSDQLFHYYGCDLYGRQMA